MKWIIKLFLERFCIWHAQRLIYWGSADRTINLFHEAIEQDLTLNFLKERLNSHIAVYLSPFNQKNKVVEELVSMIEYQQNEIAKHYGL